MSTTELLRGLTTTPVDQLTASDVREIVDEELLTHQQREQLLTYADDLAAPSAFQHLAGSYVDRIDSAPSAASAFQNQDRFDVGCEGELIDSFPTAAAALRFAVWSAEITACPHEVFDSTTGEPLVIVDPPRAA